MSDTIARPHSADVPNKDILKDAAPDLVRGLDLADSFVAFHQDPEKTTAAVLPDVAVVADKPRTAKLEGILKEDAESMQTTLSDMADLFSDMPAELRKALEAEQKSGIFGPVSQKASADYLKFLDRKIVMTICEWDALKPTEALPTGCPKDLPVDKHQRKISPELLRSLAAVDEVSVDWNWDTKDVPNKTQLDKLDAAFDWLAKCNRSIMVDRNEYIDRTFSEVVTESGLPATWQRKASDNPAEWRASAGEMIDLAVRTRNYVSAMQDLFKASRYNDFPMELPANSKITVEAFGKTHTITDKDIKDANSRAILKEGKIKDVVLDLPQDLRQEDPVNRLKIEEMRSWLTTHGEIIDQALGELRQLEKNPDAVIMYGDQEVRNAKGRFNEKDEFLGIVDPKRYQPLPGETLKDVNLIGYDFNVEPITEGVNKGKFKITQTIQAENAPVWAYLNIRALGIEKVGKPMVVDEKIIGPDEFTFVRNGDKVEAVKGSNCASFKRMQKTNYIVENGLIGALDGALLVSSVVGIGVVLQGARLGVAAGTAALRLTGVQVAKELTKNGVKLVVAGAGVANNAGARDTAGGRFINNARTAYFLGDISANLLRAGVRGVAGAGRYVRGVEAVAPTTLSGADKVHKLIHGAKLADGTVVKGMPWIRQIDTSANIAFRTTEVGFGYLVSKDLARNWEELNHPGRRDPKRDALLAVGDGRGLQIAESGAFDSKNKESLGGSKALLNNYSEALKTGRKPETQQQVGDIFEQTKLIMSPDAKPDEKKALTDRLLGNLTFSADEIAAMEKAHYSYKTNDKFKLSEKNLSDLSDRQKRRTYPKPVRELAEKSLNEKDKDVLAASRIALLYLARDKDGALPQKIGDKLTTAGLVDQMKKDLRREKPDAREIVTGDCLLRVGGIPHLTYGGVLQRVLTNPESTQLDRMRALTDPLGARMATVVDGLRYEEQNPDEGKGVVARERDFGKSFGLTSAALLGELRSVAKDDKDPDVRAMSAALVYGLNEADPDRRSTLLQDFNVKWQRSAQKPGEFAATITEFLNQSMSKPAGPNEALDSWRQSRLNAANAFTLLADGKNVAQQKAINAALSDCVSSTDANVALQAMSVLIPDRLEQLTKDDPALANKARLALLELVKKPESPEQEEALVKVLSKTETFLRGGDLGIKTELVRRLHDLLSISVANKNYAGAYPNLRAAGIQVLASLGHQGSVDIIRTHVATHKLKVGDQDLHASEPDAGVRLAAVQALEHLKDSRLRQIVNQLIEQEKDSSVAAQLREVRFAAQRIEPGTDEYSRIYQAALKDVIGDLAKHKHLEGFGSDAALAWIKLNYGLLDVQKLTERCNQEAKDVMGGVNRFFSWESTEKLREQTKVYEVMKQRQEQWNDLCKAAKGSGDHADKAKLALFYILTHSGNPMGSESGFKIYIEGDKLKKNFYNHDWAEFAARALKDAAAVGCGSRDITAYCIRMGLKEGSVRARTSDTLLEGLRKFEKPSNDGYAITREQLAKITAEALDTEILRKHEDQDEFYQQMLLTDLQKYRHRMIFPKLDAMSEKSKFPGVRTLAKNILDEFRHSVTVMWDETAIDQTATAAARADRLKIALDESNNADVTVSELFKAYKGYKLESSTDPGLPFLQQAMNDKNERTRMAAARVVMESLLAVQHGLKAKALETLGNLAVHGTVDRYRADALKELSRFNVPIPVMIKSNAGGNLRIQRGTQGLEVIKQP